MMGISFGGINSGLPVNDIIDSLIAAERRPIDQIRSRITQTQGRQTALSTIESRANSFKTALRVFTSTSILDDNIFQARKASSSVTDALDVSVSARASLSSLKVRVNNLATSTKAISQSAPGAVTTGATQLSAIKTMSLSSGTFQVFVGGVASTVNVDATTDTFADVLGRIDAISGIASASLNAEGQIVVVGDNPNTVSFGSTGDTSNFLRLSKLDVAVESAGSFTANQRFSNIDTTQGISTAGAGLATAVTAGSTFKIGKASFDTTGKTMAQILTEINNSSTAGVNAAFNNVSNRLELTSKTTGQVAIQLEDTTGNFLSAMGLIVGGNPLTSQSLGVNAKVTVNGTEYLSTSNEVSDAQTGITGVTLNLKQVKTDADIDVLVNQDTEKLTTAINSVVTAFNTLVGSIDTETKADGGRLSGQNNIRSFRSQIRQLISSSTTGAGNYNSLGLVGISTARSNGQSANSTLTFNTTKFIEALKTSPDNVEALIKGTNGIFTKMQEVVDSAVERGSDTSGDKGLFQTINDSYDAFIRRSNLSITAGEDRLERRRIALQRQFAASDSLIAQFRSQGNALSGIASSLGAG